MLTQSSSHWFTNRRRLNLIMKVTLASLVVVGVVVFLASGSDAGEAKGNKNGVTNRLFEINVFIARFYVAVTQQKKSRYDPKIDALNLL